ncbi:hypothetical protein ANO11243_091960 [Dothideomycetidae sp. 11243]|nr:hypothetical protein ANO11243_091960 [fungal sp. No.11243]
MDSATQSDITAPNLQGYDPHRVSLLAFTVTTLTCTDLNALARLCVPLRARRRWQAKDYWMLMAFVSFNTFVGICLACAHLDFTVSYLLSRPLTGESLPVILEDATKVTEFMFTMTILNWITLWSVKFSLLALYHKLMVATSRAYRYIWTITCALSFLFLIGTMLAGFFVCGPDVAKFFNPANCGSKDDSRDAAISLWIGFCCDVSTDIASESR